MSQMNRLSSGGLIDRNKEISFSFDGKKLTAYEGDTIASALLANDIKLIGRSWKYHRPRGIVGDGAEEPNAIFQIEKGKHTIPNVRGTQAVVYDGMIIQSTNAWPSVQFDLMSVFGVFSRFLPAGFYYKTFMWPQKFWMAYEHIIRKASGLGTSPRLPDPDHYEKTNDHCDVLVVGSGAAGLIAALASARSGARVVLADESENFGGRLLSETCEIESKSASQWVSDVIAELDGLENVRLLKRSTVFGYHDSNFVTIAERLTDHLSLTERNGAREKVWRTRAKQVVLATGAHERPIVFGNNDRPGVMLASAVSSYINQYAVKLASRAVLFVNNDASYATALDLHNSGTEVVAIIDYRKETNGELVKQAKEQGLTVISGAYITQVNGKNNVKSVTVRHRADGSESGEIKTQELTCDLVATSGGWNPAIHLLAQSGGKVEWNDLKVCFVPNIITQDQISVGAANGSFTLDECLLEGLNAGINCTIALGFKKVDISTPNTNSVSQEAIEEVWRSPTVESKGSELTKTPWRGAKQFIDPQNDVGVSDIYLAAREGYQSVEHVKRYTALGFGTDQGKIGNIVGMAILAEALEQDIPSTGTTTFRPNYTPVTFGAIAGPDIGSTLFEPVRKTAIHPWHEERGALFENVGQWHRPWYYPKEGETMDDAVNRECLATRESVGIMDASTLGKIEITGKDAGKFLNLMYTNAWLKLGIDCARYGFMLGEDGMVMDDGVTIRLEENKYFMHTTTGGAATVLGWMEHWLQTEWPEMEVYFTSVTDHWVTAAVVGPNSRKVVSKVVQGIEFDRESFPFMASRTGIIKSLDGDMPVRVNRISFSGELAYEVNINANYGRMMWEQIIAAGEEFNITPYGTESMHVLRAEKGYVIVGQDTDGSVTPVDLGMNWVISKTKDFIGKRSLARADCLREDRKQLVGLLTVDPNEVLPEGAQIVNEPSKKIPLPMIGHVTSSYFSACLGHSIAMAVVKNGFNRQGETIYIALTDGRMIPAVIGSSVFIDPEGERQNV